MKAEFTPMEPLTDKIMSGRPIVCWAVVCRLVTLSLRVGS